MNIIGRGFTLQELDTYVASIPRTGWSPRFVVVHNTAPPSLKLYTEDWMLRKNWSGEQWMRNLKNYYEGKGWTGGPHFFVAPDKVWALTPMWQPGVHSPSWNKISLGVETVGDFDTEPFDGAIQANLVGALAVLHRHLDLDPSDYKLGVRGLHFHREDRATTHHNCPGGHVVKEDLVREILLEIGSQQHEHASPSEAAQSADTNTLPKEADSMLWVQQQLNVHGAKLTVDGVAGPATRAAVRTFQSRNSLRVDGIAGSLTRLALWAAASGGPGH